MPPPTIPRRPFLAAAAASLAVPYIARAQSSRVLKFIPQSDLSVLDPVWSAAYVVRNHGMMVFDTLYGMDSAYQIQPQMADGHRVGDSPVTVSRDAAEGWAVTAIAPDFHNFRTLPVDPTRVEARNQ